MNKRYISLIVNAFVVFTCLLFTLSPAFAQQEIRNKPALAISFEKLIVTTPPKELNLDPFYKNYADAFGIPIISSEKVSSTTLLIARDIINYMLLKRPDVRSVMIDKKARLSIIGQTEMQTDLPECRDWKKPEFNDPRLTSRERESYNKPGGIAGMTDRGYWDQRARGMGGIQSSCAEENLLGIQGTKYYGENILIHEWSHSIMTCLEFADPDLFKQIDVAYQAAKEKAMYKGQYAINTVAEYWAEGTQWWFWSNFEFYDGTTRVQSPEDFLAYDSSLYKILAKVYPGHHAPCDVYYGKNIKK